MICKHCGNNIENNATFCPICGKIVSDGTSVGVVEIDCDDERRDSLGGRILGFGIMSLVFVNTFFLSFLGIIFGAIAKHKAARYADEFGETTGRATVGKHMGKIGLILGIVMTVLCVFYIVSLCIAALTGEFVFS